MENSRGDRYTYDNEGQLTAASYQALTPDTTPTGAQRTDSFVYDQLGNRKSPPNNQIASLGSVTFHRRDNGLNQYQDWTQSAINYEANGNLYQDGWLTASFNALNQTTGIWSWRVTPSGDAVNSAYDPLGRCVTRWSGIPTPVITYLYYDGWNLIQEGPNASTADRIYAQGNRIDEIVASQAGGVWAYHHYDARGHCILLTNASGSLLEQYDYDAFGKPYFYNASGVLQTSSSWGNKFLFTGREWLKEVAAYDFRNRHYLPELGRFIQPDPKQFAAGDYNLYRYCHNDPVNKMDPLGLGYEEHMTPVDHTTGRPIAEALIAAGEYLAGQIQEEYEEQGPVMFGLNVGMTLSRGPKIEGIRAPRARVGIPKASSPVWRGLKAFKGPTKTNGLSGAKKEYYQWDRTHGDIEAYDSKGQHKGSMDPKTGAMYKPPKKGRKIDL